jgi:hypothetical protein
MIRPYSPPGVVTSMTVIFPGPISDAAGYEKETAHEAVMERVDAEGHVVGFSIMGVSKFKKDKPLEADLAPA